MTVIRGQRGGGQSGYHHNQRTRKSLKSRNSSACILSVSWSHSAWEVCTQHTHMCMQSEDPCLGSEDSTHVTSVLLRCHGDVMVTSRRERVPWTSLLILATSSETIYDHFKWKVKAE